MNISELHSLFAQKKVSPREWALSVLDRVTREAGPYRAFCYLDPEAFLAEAEKSEQRYLKGYPLSELDGIPIGLKDLIETKDMPTTAASKILEGYRPEEDAVVVGRLRRAGANVSLGKLNLHEFAYGTTGTSSAFGPAKNPWDPTRMAGGSSSGTAIAVQRNWVMAGLGTDTGGSIRIPAALCGVTGIKPTYGLIPVRGVIPLAWTLDHVGPMARCAADVRLVLNALSDFPRDPLSPPSWGRRYRVLRPTNVGHAYRAGIERVLDAALGELDGAGIIEVHEGPLPGWEALQLLQHVIIGAEASTYHWAWLRDRPHLYQADVRERLETRAALLAVQYIEALRQRRRWQERYRDVWGQVDGIALPTVPITAPPWEQEGILNEEGEVEDVRVSLVKFTAPFNVLGLPALSHPAGFDQGLPVGLQWVAPPGRESWLLDVIERYQAITDWHGRVPSNMA